MTFFRTGCTTILVVFVMFANPGQAGAQETAVGPLPASQAVGSAGKVVGWRGDGTGKYLDAMPVTTWSYAPKSPVVGLKYQATKPAAGDDGKNAKEVWGGDVSAWLVLGAFNAKDLKGAMDEAFVPNEAAQEPAAGDKAGDLQWTPGGQDDYRDAFTPENFKKTQYGPYQLGGEAVRYYLLKGKGANTAWYAHTYLYAQSAGKVCFLVNHDDGLKVWVNGKVAYTGDEAQRNWYLYSADNAARDSVTPANCPRFEAELRKGWNRLLLKVVRKKDDGDFSLRVAAPANAEYETANIRWVTSMPSWSWSMPIVVGDRVFVTSEPDELVCINKADGKILWRHTNTTYDATSEADRAKNSIFKEIEPLNSELAKGTTADRGTVLRQKMLTLLRKIDPEKYGGGGKDGHESHSSAIGYAVMTPCSDGKNVYAMFSPGVVVCYDLDGKRQWIADIVDLGVAPTKAGKPYRPSPVTSSPVIIGGKLVVLKGWFRAFDTKTGKVAWDTGNLATDFWEGEGGIPNYSCNHSNVAFRLGGQDFLMGLWGRILRVSDGRVVAGPVLKTGYNMHCTPVLDGDFAYVWIGQKYKLSLEGDQVKMTDLGKIEGIGDFQVSSPLVYDGLIYILDAYGRLRVVDAQTLKVVYVQRLEMWPLLNYDAIGATPSVALAGKHIYLMDNQGTCVVIDPGRTFKQVAYNRLQASVLHPWPMTTNERTESAPVFDGKCIYIRGEQSLYCIGGKLAPGGKEKKEQQLKAE